MSLFWYLGKGSSWWCLQPCKLKCYLMKSFNETETLLFMHLCVLCLQRQLLLEQACANHVGPNQTNAASDQDFSKMHRFNVQRKIIAWLQGYKPFSCSTQLSMEFFMLINLKLLTSAKHS